MFPFTNSHLIRRCAIRIPKALQASYPPDVNNPAVPFSAAKLCLVTIRTVDKSLFKYFDLIGSTGTEILFFCKYWIRDN